MNFETTQAERSPYQDELTAGCQSWGSAHEVSDNHSGTSVLPEDLARFPGQRVGDNHIPVLEYGSEPIAQAAFLRIRGQLSKALGPKLMEELVEGFGEQPTSKDDKRPLSVTVPELNEAGSDVAILTAHVDMDDPAWAAGGLIVSSGSTAITEKIVMILNKVLAFEGVGDKDRPIPVLGLLRALGHQTLIFPNTSNTHKHGISDQLSKIVTLGGLKALKVLKRDTGRTVVLNLPGTVVQRHSDEQGKLQGLLLQKPPTAALNMVRRDFSHLLTVTIWPDQQTGRQGAIVDELVDIRELLERSSGDPSEVIDAYTRSQFQANLRRLSGVAVELGR